RSGAAMRAAPLGVLPTVAEVAEKCRVQAVVTHNTPDGVSAALGAALMTHYFLYEFGPKQWLPMFLQNQGAEGPGGWGTPWLGPVGKQGWMSVRAAVTALVRNWRLSDLLRDCVAFTGDVDTVATLALAAASCSPEYEQDIPPGLLAALENGPYGRDYLAALDPKPLTRYAPTPPH